MTKYKQEPEHLWSDPSLMYSSPRKQGDGGVFLEAVGVPNPNYFPVNAVTRPTCVSQYHYCSHLSSLVCIKNYQNSLSFLIIAQYIFS